MPNLNITQIPAPRVPFIDERSGLISREWYLFFQNIFILTGSGSNATTLEELQLGPPTQPGVTSVTGVPPVVSSGGATPAISMPAATSDDNGYLTSTDWNTFNNKGTVLSVSVVSANGLAGTVATATTTPAVTLSTTVTGVLKGDGTAISAATSGTDYAPATSGTSILYGSGAGGFSNVTIGTGVAFAAGTLSATGSGGTVTSVTGTAPVVSSGGATPAISIAAATTSVNGYLTSTDWNTFNGKGSGSVTSVAQSFTGGLISVAGSPITTSGTLALTVAGTSGGIPYFSSGTAWATTALLAANALMVGGGAGAAPATVTTGTGVVTALGINVGTAGAVVVNGGVLGTPSSGTVTNLTGTASININGTVGATTANTGSFTSLAYTTTLTGGTGIINLGSNQFYKDASGNVGLGVVPNVSYKLDINGALRTQGDFILSNNTGSKIYLYYATATNNNYITADTSGFMKFGTGTSAPADRLSIDTSGNILNVSTGGLGYGTGSGGAVTQLTSRTTGVTLNKTNGAITMFSAAGSAVAATFTVTNSTVAATDTIVLSVKSSTNVYLMFVTAVAAGSFNVTFQTTGGVSTDAPVINFAVIKAVTA
jgi:hypothetical protein